MADTVTVRKAPLYINKKKVGTLEDCTFEIMSNDEQIVATEGWEGATDGSLTCKAEANTFSPIGGADGAVFVNTMLNKQYVTVDVPWEGKIFSFTGRFNTANMASNMKSGKTTGKFTVEGGKLTAS